MTANLRLALRLLARSPGFSAVAVLTLAIAIGVNSAIFSLINSVLLRPAVPCKPAEVVNVFTTRQDAARAFRQFSYAEFQALRGERDVFADVAAVNFSYVSLGRGDGLRRSFSFMVSDNFFGLMGVQPAAGRFFTAAEASPNAGQRVIVAGYSLWQREGGRPDFVGSTLLVNGRPHTVIGVSPEGFSGVSALIAPDLWLPLGLFSDVTAAFGEARHSPDLADGKNYTLNLMGRMQPGLTIASAHPLLPVLAARLDAIHGPEESASTGARELVLAKPFSISPNPGDAGALRLMGFLLFGLAGVVLLIACLNLANMMLARSSARATEMAVRLALGATRGRIVGQVLTEGLLLALLVGGLGLLLSLWANSFLQDFFAALLGSMNLTLTARLEPDWRVIAATFSFCLLATLVFGLGPALKAARADLVHDLKAQAGDPAVAGRWNRFFSGRHLMVMAQMTLSLALVFSAGLFVRTALKAGGVDGAAGFSPTGVVLAELDFSLAGTGRPEALRRLQAVVERIRRQPGVEAAGLSTHVPYNNSITPARLASAETAPVAPVPGAPRPGASAVHAAITPGYLASVGIHVLRGRDFTEGESLTAGPNRVCLVDETLAQKLFPGQEALGRRLRYVEAPAGVAAGEMEIIGIVNKHVHGIEDKGRPIAGIYVPFAQAYNPALFLSIRCATSDPAAVLNALTVFRQQLRELDPDLPVVQIQPYTGFMEKNFTLWMVHLGAVMFGAFGGIALLLAMVGVYGVKAYAVQRRTREIGIRMALGAGRGEVFALVMRQAALQTACAIGAGLLLCLLAGRALAAIFFQVDPFDPLILALSVVLLAATTLLACLLPARRATRVDPLVALRAE